MEGRRFLKEMAQSPLGLLILVPSILLAFPMSVLLDSLRNMLKDSHDAEDRAVVWLAHGVAMGVLGLGYASLGYFALSWFN